MFRNSTSFLVLLFICNGGVKAQEQLQHEKKVFVSAEKRIYVNKSAPVYFRISNSPDENAPSYLLPSERTPKYANPMYFDTEGRNTLRSPSQVDPVTKKVVMPKADILFEVYADGKAPVTKINFTASGKHTKNGLTFFSGDLKIGFSAKDETSGVEATFVSVDKKTYQSFSQFQPAFTEEKQFTVAYYSVDRVGNVELPKGENFQIDQTPPVTSFKIIGESKGNVLSSRASIGLYAKDTLSGLNRIMYAINDEPEKVYKTPIPMSVLKDGKSKIHYYAVDNVGNKEESRVIAASTDIRADGDESSFSFYIDKEPPVISTEIVGDQYKGKYLFVSDRSLFKINATDEKSGVANVIYSIDNPLLRNTYSEPFPIHGEGLHTVTYASSDNVGNMALAQTQQVCLDKNTPLTRLFFRGRQFSNRDTLFITGKTDIVLSTAETGSGIQAVNYLLDGQSSTAYTGPFTVDKEGFHTLEYFAKDNVNNAEAHKTQSFFIDNTAPKIIYNFSVKAIGEKTVRDEKYIIYPSNVMLYIASTDNASGVEKMDVKINGKVTPWVNPLKGFVPGNYEVELVSYDVLRNKSSMIVRFAIEN